MPGTRVGKYVVHRRGGPAHRASDPASREEAINMYRQGASKWSICKTLHMGKHTLNLILENAEVA